MSVQNDDDYFTDRELTRTAGRTDDDVDFTDRPLTRTAAASDPSWSGSMYHRDSTGKVLPFHGGYRRRRGSRRRVSGGRVSRRRVSGGRVSRRRVSRRRHRR